MLHLLLGRSGSGKTAAVYARLRALAESGSAPLYLLVPEQFSFQSERELLFGLGEQLSSRVTVSSFTRLADRVFREVGGMAEETLDDGTRILLMSRAIEEVAASAADQGTPLMGIDPRQAGDAGTVEALVALWEELRQCAVPMQQLESVSATLAAIEPGTLANKTADLCRIFAVYEGLAAGTGLDGTDRLTRLAERLPDSRMPEGAYIFVDGFKGFTAQELQVLERLAARAKEVTVTLGTDTAGRAFGDRGGREKSLFSPVTATAQQLRRLAERHGVPFSVERLEENRRTADPQLRAVEANVFAPVPGQCDADTGAVTVTACPDLYEECAWVARSVRRLLREEGYRCRDITVVTRQPDEYKGILDDALTEEEIPFFTDARADILSEPLTVYAATALKLAVHGWRTEEILRLLKTDLGELTPVEIARLENYLYLWRLDGTAWEREWTEHPAGVGMPVTAASGRALAELNEWRRQIIEPLSALRQALRDRADGRGFATAFYRYLTHDGGLADRIAANAAALDEAGEPLLAQHTARLWDELVDLLDRFVLTLGDQCLPAARWEDLFSLLIRTVKLGNIPQGLDAVTVGQSDRIRYSHPRAVFVLGANEGCFPAYPGNGGLLSEEERDSWRKQGITLAGDAVQQFLEERYFVYAAVSAPSERLYISYRTDGGRVPSPVVKTVEDLLPHRTVGICRPDDGTDLESRRDMLERLASRFDGTDAVTAGLREVTAAYPDTARRLAAIERGAAGRPFRLEEPAVRERLFGKDLRLSASQTDTFYRCRFAYFCRYGLHIKPRPVATVDAALFGTVVHLIMEKVLPRYTAPGGLADQLKAEYSEWKDLPADQRESRENARQASLMATLQADAAAVTDAFAAETSARGEQSASFLYALRLARQAGVNILWHTLMELRQSRFTPADFELTIHPDNEQTDGILSLKLPTAAGGHLQVSGKIDRVDLFVREDGTAYVRVVDYKTGTKEFKPTEVAAGINMQMLLYLYILCDNAVRYAPADGVLHPAGVLYHPLSDLTVTRQSPDANKERLSSMQMKGLVLDEPEIITAMDEQGDGVFIPVKLTGRKSTGAVTARHFELLRGVIEDLLTGMAASLNAGDIEALPLEADGGKIPCDYCDYRTVCAREEDGAVRTVPYANAKELYETLENAASGEVTDRG